MVDLREVRDRSLTVRRDARSMLEALRAQRAASPRWVPVRYAPPTATPSAEMVHDVGGESVDAVSKGMEPPPSEAADEPSSERCSSGHDLDFTDHASSTVQTSVAPVSEAQSSIVSEVEPATTVDDSELMASTEPDGRDAEPVKRASPTTEPKPARRPARKSTPSRGSQTRRKLKLDDIPGLQAGLIWRLEQIGITTGEELAQTEPALLAERLGPAGRILNVEAIVRLAGDLIGRRD